LAFGVWRFGWRWRVWPFLCGRWGSWVLGLVALRFFVGGFFMGGGVGVGVGVLGVEFSPCHPPCKQGLAAVVEEARSGRWCWQW